MNELDRLPPVSPAEWTDLQRQHVQAIFDGPRGALIAPFVPLLRSPEFMNTVQRMGEYLRYRSDLDARLFELAVLLIARHWSQDVEWAIHAPLALGAGIAPEVVDAIARNEKPAVLAADESALYRLVTELMTTQHVSDAAWFAITTALGERGTVDLLGVCGYYSMLAMIMNAARTPVPSGAHHTLLEAESVDCS